MNEVVFEIVKAILGLAVVLLMRYAIPWLKLQVENTKYSWVLTWVDIAVSAQEQTVFGDKSGPEKKAIVTEFIKSMLIEKNIAMSDEQISNLIEAAVYAMNIDRTR